MLTAPEKNPDQNPEPRRAQRPHALEAYLEDEVLALGGPLSLKRARVFLLEASDLIGAPPACAIGPGVRFQWLIGERVIELSPNAGADDKDIGLRFRAFDMGTVPAGTWRTSFKWGGDPADQPYHWYRQISGAPAGVDTWWQPRYVMVASTWEDFDCAFPDIIGSMADDVALTPPAWRDRSPSLTWALGKGSVTAGGALMNTTEVENYPGFIDGIMGPQLMTQMQEQAERFGADVRYEDVTALELTGDVKRITTDDAVYEARAVIISTGSEYRKLGLEDEERLSGHGVSYCATCDGFFFKDQPIVVVGGGDSAMEEALFLSRFGSSVTVVHRRDELRASAVMAKRAHDDPKIDFAWNSRVVALNGQEALTSATLEDVNTGERRDIPAAGLFVAIGQIPRSELVADALELDDAGYITVQAPSQQTAIPGVFACGDVADPHYQQAITAAGSGCRAALDAEHYLATLTA